MSSFKDILKLQIIEAWLGLVFFYYNDIVKGE